MEVHHPKHAVRDWRALFNEVGIIVVGVLIALAGEQLVEWVHWRHKAEVAREAMQEELAGNQFAAIERVRVTPCLLAQLDRMRDAVLAPGTTLRPLPTVDSPLGPTTFRHPSRMWTDAIWQSVVTEQVSSRFGREERQIMATMAAEMATLRTLQAAEDDAGGDLNILALPIALDPATRVRLLSVIAQERTRVAIMSLIASQMLEAMTPVRPTLTPAQKADWRDSFNNPRSTIATCRAQHLPLTS